MILNGDILEAEAEVHVARVQMADARSRLRAARLELAKARLRVLKARRIWRLFLWRRARTE